MTFIGRFTILFVAGFVLTGSCAEAKDEHVYDYILAGELADGLCGYDQASKSTITGEQITRKPSRIAAWPFRPDNKIATTLTHARMINSNPVHGLS